MKRIYPLLILVLITLHGACSPLATPEPAANPATDGGTGTAVAGDPGETALPTVERDVPRSPMIITEISDNRGTYPGEQIPRYEKFEITFQIQGSVARNFQFPYDPSPPSGIDPAAEPYQGISVNAVFTPDDWQTLYVQPAFYYQGFIEEPRDQGEWIYPNGDYAWKARFAPHLAGEWQYRLVAEDASGVTESTPQAFRVSDSASPGFIQVSPTDPRYFEFDDGSYFPALGYNLTFNGINWASPTLGNEPNFQTLSENGIQFVRTWLTSAGIFASAWNPWGSIAPVSGEGYVPFSGLSSQDPNPATGSETSMIVNARFNPCMFIGWLSPPPAVKANTNYRVRLRYRTENIAGPRYEGSHYGLVAKIGGWLWGQGGNCHDPGTGTLVTGHVSENSFGQADDWRTLEGSWNSGDNHFLPYFYIAMENVNRGRAWIDHVAIEEDLGDGQYGPNILSKPWMSHHLYFDQRNSYAFDQILELAYQYDIYLRPVILEKDEWAQKRITPDGAFDDDNPDVDHFYGGRQASKTRWLQQAWWRYIQARWGYSTNIHSWELLNEGDPANSRHWALADEFGKYMGCRVFSVSVGAGDGERCNYDHPNAHPVSTSNWHSFPAREFWASPDYPNLGFADLHAYNSTGWLDEKLHEKDAAAYHLAYSRETRAAIDGASGERPTKPVVRGEAGIDFLDEQREQPDLKLDQNGVWLHNFLWSTLDPSGLIELYWWGENIAGSPGPDGEPGLYEIFAYFHDFIADIPLNNGHYQEAGAVASTGGLRLTGQVDLQNQRAHLWVQNPDHIWRNVVDGKSKLSGLSGTVAIEGFEPGQSYRVEWHEFTTQGVPNIRVAQVEADSNGALSLSLPADPRITDVGIKIGE